jgi:hypothetical protein
MANNSLAIRWRATELGAAAFVIWVVTVTLGFRVLAKYEARPGPRSSVLQQWTSASSISLDPNRPTLLLFVHPHCPCSRASIDELARLMTRVQARVSIQVIVYKPAEVHDDWSHTDLWRSAAMLPGVSLKVDLDGAEATRFHATTSGQAMLYDTQGHLLFSGGITPGRGHVGDNAGSTAIIALLSSGKAEHLTTPVYGCYFQSPVSAGSGKTTP